MVEEPVPGGHQQPVRVPAGRDQVPDVADLGGAVDDDQHALPGLLTLRQLRPVPRQSSVVGRRQIFVRDAELT
ncbi:hypothetical protein [Streptomyces sp. SudanB52_2052]|uniref:hypothetical protein n=1 Tax=Streptomyces sp. SudanB52_2052 TaxID=3035276 RepID=UPI003F5650A8